MKQVATRLDHRRRRGSVRFIVVHHSNTASAEDTRNVLRRRGLSTHFEVEKDGQVFQYFDPAEVVTYHAGVFNSPSIGIDMTHVHKAPWPGVQVEAGHRLIRDLCERFRLPVMVAPVGVRYATLKDALASGFTVLRHSNLRNTICPDGFPLEIGGAHE